MKNILLLLITSLVLMSCKKEPGSFSGNIYWKYNDFVGNKPDAGCKIQLYSIADKKILFETTSDVSGNFKIDEIPVGKYFAIIQSNNTTDSPKDHLDNLTIYSQELNYLFNYDLRKHKSDIDEINKLNDLYLEALTDDKPIDNQNNLAKNIESYENLEAEMKNKSFELISKLPDNFKKNFHLYTGYDNSLKFITVEIKEGKNITENIDFGTTYN